MCITLILVLALPITLSFANSSSRTLSPVLTLALALPLAHSHSCSCSCSLFRSCSHSRYLLLDLSFLASQSPSRLLTLLLAHSQSHSQSYSRSSRSPALFCFHHLHSMDLPYFYPQWQFLTRRRAFSAFSFLLLSSPSFPFLPFICLIFPPFPVSFLFLARCCYFFSRRSA